MCTNGWRWNEYIKSRNLPPLSKIAESRNDIRLIIKSLIDPTRNYLQQGESRTKCFQTLRRSDLI